MKTMMKSLTKHLIAVAVTICALPVFGQDQTEVSDEQLWRYALAMEVVDQMKKDISVEVNALIKKQEGMTGQRYKELAATKGDEAKLADIEAQDWEIKFLEATNGVKDSRTAAIKTVISELATKMVGNSGKTYKMLKEQISSDDEIKTRYEAIKQSLSSALMSS